jgi:ATP/maltotriose-dependent transcriptional regulator MalT
MLVLDDFHVIDNPQIEYAVAFLLNHISPVVSVQLVAKAHPLDNRRGNDLGIAQGLDGRHILD